MPLKSAILTHARQQADRQALRLLAYASAVFPDPDGLVGNIVAEDLIETGVSFAVNARRCLENFSSDRQITESRWNYNLTKGIVEETSLKRALNGLIHARNLRIHAVRAHEVVFEKHENGFFSHFVYETDRYPETYVRIFGIAWAFISTPRLPELEH